MNCIVYRVVKNQTQLTDFHFHFSDPWVSWGLIFLVCCLWILVRRDVQKSLANSEILKKCSLWIFSILSLTWS